MYNQTYNKINSFNLMWAIIALVVIIGIFLFVELSRDMSQYISGIQTDRLELAYDDY